MIYYKCDNCKADNLRPESIHFLIRNRVQVVNGELMQKRECRKVSHICTSCYELYLREILH